LAYLKVYCVGLVGYLDDRNQKVVLHGESSQSKCIGAGVPQGSILGPVLLLIFVNDNVEDITSSIRLFADDTSLYIVVNKPDHAAEDLNKDIDRILAWSKRWLVTFNPDKTESLIIPRKIIKTISSHLFHEQ